MQTRSSLQTAHKLHDLVPVFSSVSWLGCVIQAGLAIAIIAALIMAGSTLSLGEESTPGIEIGIFWAVCGLVLLLANLYLAIRYIRIVRRLKQREAQPRGSDIIRAMEASLVIALVGMLLMIVGDVCSLGAILMKAIAQPYGIALPDPKRFVRGLDVLIALSNTLGIAAHYVGTMVPLFVLRQLYRL